MKRSKINQVIEDGMKFIESQHFHLPDFAYWKPEDFKGKREEYDEVFTNMLGWDVSDFGGEGIADENGVAEAFSSVTHFWTPESHPWQEGQMVRLTARVEDDQGVVYERELVLLP